MSDLAAEMHRLGQAARGPALNLINHKWSALVLGVFRLTFGARGGAVRAERLHSQVDSYLEELRELGHEVPPHATGRTLCLSWTHEQWLTRIPTEDGGEAYERTSHALVADRVMGGLTSERALLSESRLTTILDAARRWASEANPDRQARMAGLQAQIDALGAELERLAAGGAMSRADEESMGTGYADVTDLLAQLPGDFRRVEESLERIHRKMINDFRRDDRPKGEVLDAYLEASEHLMTATDEGRAFEGALRILNDDALLARFREDLRTILEHPFAANLSPKARSEFLGAASVLRRGLYDVQSRQHKASRSLADYLSSADAAADRRVSQVLHRLQQELALWMQTARPRDAVSLERMPARAELAHLRLRLHDPVPPPPAEPLAHVLDEAPEPLSLSDVRRYGGPLLREVRQGVLGSLDAGQSASLGEAFNTLPEHLRRPVELYGLMELAAEWGLDPEGGGGQFDVVTAQRPDGSLRTLSIPHLELADPGPHNRPRNSPRTSPHSTTAPQGSQQEKEEDNG
ncbi:DUF3375 domain-containing protein [Galactobacter caseinivorans]|uniref:DUF3375 domain-containing protein n=1 Tax=Galactobacter caseinivorans TaxID=2676123 RepID=UPI0013143DCF|nr:DUF3375 domain-containing protein [Galactobacter caseinivorans]